MSEELTRAGELSEKMVGIANGMLKDSGKVITKLEAGDVAFFEDMASTYTRVFADIEALMRLAMEAASNRRTIAAREATVERINRRGYQARIADFDVEGGVS